MTHHQQTLRCARFAQEGYRNTITRRRNEADTLAHRRTRAQHRLLREREEEVDDIPANDDPEPTEFPVPGPVEEVVAFVDQGEVAPPVEVIDLTDPVKSQEKEEIQEHEEIRERYEEGHDQNQDQEQGAQQTEECMVCYDTSSLRDLEGCSAGNEQCDVYFDHSCIERCLYITPKCPMCQVDVPGRQAHRSRPHLCTVRHLSTPDRRGLRSEGTGCDHVYHFECLYAKCLKLSRLHVTHMRGCVLCPKCTLQEGPESLTASVGSRNLAHRLRYVDIELNVVRSLAELPRY